jgi:CRP-like cAMP-binding protein
VNSKSNCYSDTKTENTTPPALEKFMMAPTMLDDSNYDLDPKIFLGTIGTGRRIVTVLKNQTIFTQGEAADSVFYIQKGRVRLTIVSRFGKEAILGILSQEEFFGDGALAGQPLRMGSAIAITNCRLLRIEKPAMMLALHRGRALSRLFVAYLMARNARYYKGFVDLLFDSCEKRLARVLLLLAHYGEEGTPEEVIPRVSQRTLADMASTTPARVSYFMNRFTKSNFLAYGKSGMQIHSSLLNVVLHN